MITAGALLAFSGGALITNAIIERNYGLIIAGLGILGAGFLIP